MTEKTPKQMCRIVRNNIDNRKFGYTRGAFASSNMDCGDIDMVQLDRGIKIEVGLQNNNDFEWATKKALDNITKNPTYYANKEIPPKASEGTHKVVEKALDSQVPMAGKLYQAERKSGNKMGLSSLVDKVAGK